MPLTLPGPMPTAPHPPSGPEVGAAGCVHPAPRPSGPRLGSASGGPRRKPGWEAGEGSSPSPRLSLRECGWTPTCSSTRGHSSQRGASPSCSLRPLWVPGSTLPRPLRAQRNERPHRCWPWSLHRPRLLPRLIPPSSCPRLRTPALRGSLAHAPERPAPSCLPCSASARERWGGGAKVPKLRAVLVFHIRPALPAPGEQATPRRGLWPSGSDQRGSQSDSAADKRRGHWLHLSGARFSPPKCERRPGVTAYNCHENYTREPAGTLGPERGLRTVRARPPVAATAPTAKGCASLNRPEPKRHSVPATPRGSR